MVARVPPVRAPRTPATHRPRPHHQQRANSGLRSRIREPLTAVVDDDARAEAQQIADKPHPIRVCYFGLLFRAMAFCDNFEVLDGAVFWRKTRADDLSACLNVHPAKNGAKRSVSPLR